MNKAITKAQLTKIHVLLNQLGLKEQKASIINDLTKGRTESSKEITLYEARDLIEYLSSNDKDDRMRRKVFALAYEIGISWGETAEDKKMNAVKIDKFLQEKGSVKKPLYKMNHKELIQTINQFEQIKKHNDYSKAGKATKSLLNELKINTNG